MTTKLQHCTKAAYLSTPLYDCKQTCTLLNVAGFKGCTLLSFSWLSWQAEKKYRLFSTWCYHFAPDFCDSDEDTDEDERDANPKEGPDSSKISTTTTEDAKERDGALNKLNSFGEGDSRLKESRTEKGRADSRQSPVTLISSTTRSGEELKSPSVEQPKVDECRSVSKESYTTPLTVQTDPGAHLNQSHLHSFGFPPSLAGQQFFNHLGSAHPFLLHPSQFNMGGAFSNMAAGMGPLLAAVSSGGVTSMDTASMASPSQSLTGVAGVPFHLQQHVLASQVNNLVITVTFLFNFLLEFFVCLVFRHRQLSCVIFIVNFDSSRCGGTCLIVFST